MINIPKFDKDKEEYITNLMKEFAVENNPICARVEKVQDDCKVDIIDKLMVKDHEIAVLKKALEIVAKMYIFDEKQLIEQARKELEDDK